MGNKHQKDFKIRQRRKRERKEKERQREKKNRQKRKHGDRERENDKKNEREGISSKGKPGHTDQKINISENELLEAVTSLKAWFSSSKKPCSTV